jgi:4-amino-4-deoxy-L-arabinose transferase-like glycosyltransferase
MRYLIHNIRERIKIEHVIILWLAVNIVSAFFTRLYSDEAYYTLFAKQLDFGYFDHPPMIALMIRIGSFLLKNEIGVRLLSVIAITLALYFTYRLADVHKPVLFLTAIFSMFGLNILGFLALPDSPLLFFSVLFFLIYKKFLNKENILNSILLGVTMAAMLYSKYHGILILLFTIISNLKLLRSGKFRLAMVIAFLLFLPHIIWQLNNNLEIGRASCRERV